MLPSTIDYILSLKDASGRQVASHAQYQVIIPNFPPLTSINYNVQPADPLHAYILYDLVFGEAMVPHSFSVKIKHGADNVLDIIVSGRFTTLPFQVFVILGQAQPGLNVSATNLRLLANYFELTTSYVTINSPADYLVVVDALRRMHTSARSEQLLSEIDRLLKQMVDQSSGLQPPIVSGGRR